MDSPIVVDDQHTFSLQDILDDKAADPVGRLTRFVWFSRRVFARAAAKSRGAIPVEPDVMQLVRALARTPRRPVGPARRAVAGEGGVERSDLLAARWAALAGLSQDEAALASVVANEVGNDVDEAIIVCEATCRQAAAAKRSVFDQVVNVGRNAGYFARQSGRWCASLGQPRENHLAIARAVLHARDVGKWLISPNARRWVAGRVMDRGFQAGKPLAYNAVSLMEKWGREGWQIEGPFLQDDGETSLFDPYLFAPMEFVGPGKANVGRSVAIMFDGRARHGVKPRSPAVIRDAIV